MCFCNLLRSFSGINTYVYGDLKIGPNVAKHVRVCVCVQKTSLRPHVKVPSDACRGELPISTKS